MFFLHGEAVHQGYNFFLLLFSLKRFWTLRIFRYNCIFVVMKTHLIISCLFFSNLFQTYLMDMDTQNMRLHNSKDHLECLDLHLKKLRISYYHGTRSHVEFAKFFVLNTRVLESMVLDVEHRKIGYDWWIENQRRQLQLKKRASIGAQLSFTSDDCFNYLNDIHEFRSM